MIEGAICTIKHTAKTCAVCCVGFRSVISFHLAKCEPMAEVRISRQEVRIATIQFQRLLTWFCMPLIRDFCQYKNNVAGSNQSPGARGIFA